MNWWFCWNLNCICNFCPARMTCYFLSTPYLSRRIGWNLQISTSAGYHLDPKSRYIWGQLDYTFRIPGVSLCLTAPCVAGEDDVFTISRMPIRYSAGDGNDFNEIAYAILIGLLFMLITTNGRRLHLVGSSTWNLISVLCVQCIRSGMFFLSLFPC